uniref:G-protein coupled receptors family 1 profile domain-containing protein n=1 Tax=Setaria digitata TaxID=48799 RepID=A0A915PSD1_9BILA
MTIIIQGEDQFANYKQLEYSIPFQGYRRYVAFAYMGVNAVGFAVNFWVLYTVAPLLFSMTVKVPKSILFYIMTLCISDLMIMIGMLFLIIDIVVGTWKFSTFSCVAYLVFEAMNKFVAPVIVVLISRTCYVTVCLDPKSRRIAASLKYAVAQVIASMALVMIMLWPVFVYSQVSTLYFNANITLGTVYVLRKCTFMPPSEIELGFGIVSCIASYAIPLGGMIYWYVSVPFFLRKRAGSSLASSNSNAAPLCRLVATVLVLTAVYVSCWSPYWLSIFAHKFINRMSRSVVIASYYIHLLPYISCSAYPVIFTLLNRRIKTARAQMNLYQKRRNGISSFGTSKTLRVCIRLLPNFANQSITHLDSKNRSDSTTNRFTEKEMEYSTDDSVKSLKSSQFADDFTDKKSSVQRKERQSLEVIEMEEADFLL